MSGESKLLENDRTKNLSTGRGEQSAFGPLDSPIRVISAVLSLAWNLIILPGVGCQKGKTLLNRQ